MKIAALIFAILAVASAAKAWLIYGGVDNGTVLAFYVITTVVCIVAAVISSALA